MKWTIHYSSQAVKFLHKNPSQADSIKDSLRLLTKKISGETVSLDIKKMKGAWAGSLRIRKGKIRIIITINDGEDDNEKIIHVNILDYRGDVYK